MLLILRKRELIKYNEKQVDINSNNNVSIPTNLKRIKMEDNPEEKNNKIVEISNFYKYKNMLIYILYYNF